MALGEAIRVSKIGWVVREFGDGGLDDLRLDDLRLGDLSLGGLRLGLALAISSIAIPCAHALRIKEILPSVEHLFGFFLPLSVAHAIVLFRTGVRIPSNTVEVEVGRPDGYLWKCRSRERISCRRNT